MNTESEIDYTNREDGARAVELKIAEDMAGKDFGLNLYLDEEKNQKLETINFQVSPHLISAMTESDEDGWQKKGASVKQIKASDTTVVIEITNPGGKKFSADQEFRYDIQAAAIKPDWYTVLNQVNLTAFPDRTYDGKYYEAKTTVSLRLFDSSVSAGRGRAQSFELVVKPYMLVEGEKVYGMETRMVISTVNPYYPEKLVLKNQKKQVYTGQYCKVADLDFGKNSYMDDSVYSVSTDNEYVKAEIKNGSLYVHPDLYADSPSVLGKTNVTVWFDLEKDEFPPVSTKLTLQVVQGIEDLELVVPRADAVTELYKQPGKALKLNTRLVYNEGKTVPKTKKVGYSLGRMKLNQYGKTFFVEDAGVLDGAVKVSASGVITISKDYKLDSNPLKNWFAVRVYAKDFEGNESVESVVEIRLTDEKASMGEPVLTTGTDEEFKIFDSVSVEDLRDKEVQVRVLKPGVDQSRETFGKEDLTGVPYTTSLQKNKFIVAAGNRLELKSINNLRDDKFVVTVTSQNGNRESKKLSFQIENVEYKDPRVYIYGYHAVPLYTKDEEEVKERGGVNQTPESRNGIYALSLGDGKEEGTLPEEIFYPSDYKINVKGGRITFDLADAFKTGTYNTKMQKGKMIYFYFTSPKATITLTDYKGKKIAQYEVENTELKDVTIMPKVTVVKNTQPYTGYSGKQAITFTLDQKTRKLLKDKELTLVSTYGVIEAAYLFGTPFDDSPLYSAPVDKETGKATMQYSVKSSVPSKGKMMFYVIDTNTRERLSKNSAPVTVQTIPLKKSFKLNTSYKLSTASGKSVELKGRAAGVAQVTYKGLYNVSVKGKSNYFTELFELGEDQKLKLKNSISKRLLKDQKNLTGYVYLEVTYLDGTTAEMYQKITVKLTK